MRNRVRAGDECSFQLVLPVELRRRLRMHKACTGEDLNDTIVRATERLLSSEPPTLGGTEAGR